MIAQMFSPVLKTTRTIRFAGILSTSSVPVTVSRIASVLGMAVATATTAFPLVYSFRVRRVRVWASNTTNIPSGLRFIWRGSGGSADFGEDKEYNSESLSQTQPAYIDAVPPPNTAPSFWFNGDSDLSTTVFSFQATSMSSGSISTSQIVLDLTVDMTLNNNLGTNFAAATVVGQTAGNIIYNALDGSGGALLPLGVTNVAVSY